MFTNIPTSCTQSGNAFFNIVNIFFDILVYLSSELDLKNQMLYSNFAFSR